MTLVAELRRLIPDVQHTFGVRVLGPGQPITRGVDLRHVRKRGGSFPFTGHDPKLGELTVAYKSGQNAK